MNQSFFCKQYRRVVVAAAASMCLTMVARADTATKFFAGSIVLDGNIADFFQADGLTPKDGVCVANDPNGLNEPPLAQASALDNVLHPSAFNQRRIMSAYNPSLNGGTVFIGIDLPGGSGADSNSKTVHALPGNANPNYNDGVVGFNGGGNGFGRGKIVPFDADGNGEADTIGRTAAGGLLYRCPPSAGDIVDILNCGNANATGATDNPRTSSGEAVGARETYVAQIFFSNGSLIAVQLQEGSSTAAGVADVSIMTSGTVAPVGATVSTTTGATGVPLNWDIEIAITNVNAAVGDPCAVLNQTLLVDSGSNRDGAGQGEDQNTLVCNYQPPTQVLCDVLFLQGGQVVMDNTCPNPVLTLGRLVQSGPVDVVVVVSNSAQSAQSVINCNIDVSNIPGLSDVVAPGPLLPGQSSPVLVGTLSDAVPASFTVVANVTCEGQFTSNCIPIMTTCEDSIEFCGQCSVFINKLIACRPANGDCANAVYNTVATGAKSATQNPAFCYSVTVENTSDVPLTLLAVFDDKLGNLTSRFPSTLAAGQMATTFVTTNHAVNTINTVTVTGQCVVAVVNGVPVTTNVTATSSATAQVVPASISCIKQVSTNGVDFSNSVDITLGVSTPVTYRVITTAGAIDLDKVTITDVLLQSFPECAQLPAAFKLAANRSVTNVLCTVPLICTQIGAGVNTVNINAEVDVNNQQGICALDKDGQPIKVSTSCEATVNCVGAPKIQVIKEVVCKQGTTPCGSLPGSSYDGKKTASGVKSADGLLCPTFCYRIIVKNTGSLPLVNVAVTDPLLGAGSLPGYPATLAIGQSVTNFFEKTLCVDTPNTVTAIGEGINETGLAQSQDSANVTVKTARISCAKTVSTDGVNFTSSVSILNDGQPHQVFYRIVVTNNSDAGVVLSNLTVTDPVLAGCNIAGQIPATLAAGASFTVNCEVTLNCANITGGTLVNTVTVGGQADAQNNTVCVTGPDGLPVRVTSQCSATVNCQPCTGTIGDFVWNDLNRDGCQDANEPGIQGVKVDLYQGTCGTPGTFVTSKFTDSTGKYLFTDLCPGNYQVVFNTPGGFAPTLFHQACNVGGQPPTEKDSDCNGTPVCVTLTSAKPNDLSIDCGYVCIGEIGDFVWSDEDGDGCQDPTEPGIQGVTVELYSGACGQARTFVKSVQTDGTGHYRFTQLCPGDYQVEFITPNGLAPTLPHQACSINGLPPEETDSNCGAPICVTLTPTQPVDLSIDCGYVCIGKIGDFVWNDQNGNGCQDPTEPGIQGVTVELYSGACGQARTFIKSVQTDSTGHYLFTGLCAGDYQVEFITPNGFAPTLPHQACSINGLPPEETDSNCGAPICVTLTPTKPVDLSIDCGYVQPCQLVVTKGCAIPPPPPGPFDCSGAKPITSMTVIWNGSQTIYVKAWNGSIGTGTPSTFGPIAPSQQVTFTRSTASTPNDIYFELFTSSSMTAASKIGNSTFHLSCSDVDMDGTEDCGKAAGDGKGQTGYINQWIFAGMAGNGQVLDCNPTPPTPTPQAVCDLTPVANPGCGGALGKDNKPTSLTFRYTGGGCAASNNPQSGKFICSGSVNTALPVTVATSNGYTISPTTVAPGGEFTVSTGSFNAQSNFTLSNSGGTESLSIHTSCSQLLQVGDVFGDLTLVGFNGQGGGANIIYIYTVTNTGPVPVQGVVLTDDQLGAVAGPFNLPAGGSQTFQVPVEITMTVTNVATAMAGPNCVAKSSAVIVRVPEIPPTPECPTESCSDFNDKLIPAGNTVWFNGVVKVGKRDGKPGTVMFTDQRIKFTANGVNYDLPAPDTLIIFSATATQATTMFDTGSNQWVTTVPVKYTGNVSIGGLAFPAPAGGLPKKLKPVCWSGGFGSDIGKLEFEWKWAAAVYSTFSTDYNALGVKPIDGDKLNPYKNGDHAGTPENFKSYVVAGARGGGGSNYTGSYSGSKKLTCGTPGTSTECSSAIVAFLVEYTGPSLSGAQTLKFVGLQSPSTIVATYFFPNGLTTGTLLSLPMESDPNRPWTIDATKHNQTKLGTKTEVYFNNVLTEVFHTSCSCNQNNFIPGQPACLDSSSPDNPTGTKGYPSPLFLVQDFK